MSDNKLLCIVWCVAIVGCSTCRVSNNWLKAELEKTKAAERAELIKTGKPE